MRAKVFAVRKVFVITGAMEPSAGRSMPHTKLSGIESPIIRNTSAIIGSSAGDFETVGESSWRPVAQWLADFPLMAERIEDPAQAPAVLVGHRRGRGGASPDRPRERRVGIINQQQGPASG